MKKKIFRIILVLLFFFLGLIILKIFFFEIVTIPSNSMLPTLFPGDYVLISKTKTARLEDIVVFKRGEELFIKRVVAEAGDKFSYVDDKIIVNEKSFSYYETQVKEKLPTDISDRSFRAYNESSTVNSFPLSGHHILIDKNKLSRKITDILIPKSHYFVLGDNRNHSLDSRDFGSIKFNDVVGTAIFWW